MLNLLIVVLASTYLGLEDTEYSSFVSANERTLRTLLGNGAADSPDVHGDTLLYTVDETVSHLNRSSTNYFSFAQASIGEFTVLDSVRATAVLANGPDTVYTLTPQNPLGPFSTNASALRKFINEIEHLDLEFKFNNTLFTVPGAAFQQMAMAWTCYARYDMSADVEVRYFVGVRSALRNRGMGSDLGSVDLFTVLLCIWHTILVAKALRKSVLVFRYARRRLTARPAPRAGTPIQGKRHLHWSQLSISDKLSFFNFWHVASLFANSCLILAALINTSPAVHADMNMILPAERVLRSVGVFLSWVTLVKYLEWDHEFYMLVTTVKVWMHAHARRPPALTPAAGIFGTHVQVHHRRLSAVHGVRADWHVLLWAERR